ncbi:ImmA/IrrE family metallo-endopeptidase [Knoellia sp. LjRoot47]
MRQVAQEERAGLHLDLYQPLDPYALAAEHGIPVYSFDDLLESGCPIESVQHFTRFRASSWSAALVAVGSHRRFIIENAAHAPVRRRSSIAHELGHHLLEHVFDRILLADDGCRRFDAKMEKEADYLAGELLIPKAAAERAAFAGWNNDQVAQHFAVSTQFAQLRMYGARVFAKRALAKQSRRGNQ